MKTLKTTLIAVAMMTVAAPSMAAEPLVDLTNSLASTISAQVIEMTSNLQTELGESLSAAAAEFVSSASTVAKDIAQAEVENQQAAK